jgi:hypothetical protein
MADPTSRWAIGIYRGCSPFEFKPDPEVTNPVLSHLSVSDVPAQFVADPFMIQSGATWYMFFEVLNKATNKGEIGLATSPDGRRWEYSRIVLTEPFHLSYPFVFENEGEFYMLPESEAAGRIQLYRASRFPFEWTPCATLLEQRAADATVFFHNSRWWMLSCATPYLQDTLSLHMAEEPAGRWIEHPLSPIVRGSRRNARPAGRPAALAGRIVRYAQDCETQYGAKVRALTITELSPDTYAEVESNTEPVLSAGEAGWNARRMHHIDPHILPDGTWIACADGDSIPPVA